MRIVDTNKRHHLMRWSGEPLNLAHDPLDLSKHAQITCDTEALYTVTIPESQLKVLATMEERLARFSQHGDMSTGLLGAFLDQEREEIHLRETMPALANLYEQYEIMLQLAGFSRKV